MKKIFITLFAFFLLVSCTNTEVYNNINKDGSFVITSDGIKKDFTETDNTKITWYTDTRCPDCIRTSSALSDYINKEVKNNNLEVKYYPVALLEKKSEYSLDGAIAILGVEEYEPNKLVDFVKAINDSNDTDVKERNSSYIQETYDKVGIDKKTQNNIKKNEKKLENLVKNSTMLAKDKYKEKFFVPYILVNDNEEPLEGESKDPNDVLEPIKNAIGDTNKCKEEELNCDI